ncbi:hypothetical protein B0S90_0665 [Caldicellulosiruptor bescii]|uniref:Uncharacterized protein n=2 Tax=Caldicellulosiruptor bescii TaxID=31899 RepID=B9MN72_CALBD|nr:hypothetical protein [Caldicellulosiruptor bescii]ACM59528.1 conserved hypothetical protein [Caldicellulosiruptor bescii DSM 6725]PBC89558.1 hypothetical protein B0S87_2667 [Caldicellulosiruptor bescii]PBC89881.1 hypothetical protein B0S89_0169 [Caldicellulosiruptor bescii]PBD04692.1 hypothetical protein B0S85_2380 [Caldicellulosiruptor bescii]PBD05677.1 hypothetical protein B0S90_0665 [Caldicellulosiruptor bescii]
MIENLPFTRFVVILKGIEQKGKIPFGYVKIQAIVDTVNFEIVIQGLEETEDKMTFWGVVKKSDGYSPVFLTALSKPQKGDIVQFLSTSRFNLFKSSLKLSDLFGFAVAKEKKGEPNFILIGSFDDSSLYEMERDILRSFEKGESKKNGDKKDMDNHDEKKEVEVEKEEKTESSLSKDDDKSLDQNCSQDVEKEIMQAKEQEAECEMLKKSAEKSEKEEESSEIVESISQELQKAYQDESREENFHFDVEKNYCILEFGDKKIWKRIFEELKEKCERFDPFSDDKVKWFKIEKKDIISISHLHPFLYVIFNPFVFNLVSEHGYLIIGYRRSKRKRDRVEILVPAEFSEETEKVAKSFGFSEFVTKDGKVMDGKEGYFKMSLELIEKEE